jgi:hypothetical protein
VLYGVRRFGSSGSSVGVDGGGVGEDPRDLDLVRLPAVASAEQEGPEDGSARSDDPEVGAHVGEDPGSIAAYPPILVRGQLHVLDLIPTVVGGQVALGPGLGPLDGTSDPLGELQGERLLRIHLEL